MSNPTRPNAGVFPDSTSTPIVYPTISAILNGLATQLLEQIAPTTLDGGGVLLGPEAIAQQGKPFRVVALLSGDQFDYSDQNGANPQPLRARLLGIEWHVWGFDYDSAMQLADQIAVAHEHQAPGLWEIKGGKWTNQTTVSVHGREYVFGTTIALPLVDTPWRVVTGVSNANTGIMVFPNTETTACGGP
jgi:hypothetical protein